jgi:hypothetical protein
VPVNVPASLGGGDDFAPRTLNTEDLDIPTFLRKRMS